MSLRKIKIYCGQKLSIDPNQFQFSKVILEGPIRRGDIQKDIDKNVSMIGIVDGFFHSQLAVTPSEILDALRMGVLVFGSASMGAIRAVELQNEGMIGVGRIYQHIKSHDFFRDDFLGQIYPEDLEFSPELSHLEIQLALDDLKQEGKITSKEYSHLIKASAKVHFHFRNLKSLAAEVEGLNLEASRSKKVIRLIQNLKSQKSKDATEMISAMAKHLKSVDHFYLKN